MAAIQDNINRINQAKADIKEAIIAKGVEVSDDVKIDGYAEKIGEIQQGGGGQFAIDYGEEIYTNNPYSMNAEQEDIDYYNQIQAERAAYAAGTGGRSDAEIQADPEFTRKIAWWPKGMKYPNSFDYYSNIKEFNDKSASLFRFRECWNIKSIIILLPANMGYICKNNGVMDYFHAEDYSSVTTAYYAFERCYRLKKFIASMPKLTAAQNMFNECNSIDEIRIPDSKIESVSMFAYMCNRLKTLELGLGLKSNGTWQSFACENLEDCLLRTWDAYNVDLSRSPKITPYSIHFILNHTESATTRTITLHATAKTNWEASEYYEEDVARAQELNITIA